MLPKDTIYNIEDTYIRTDRPSSHIYNTSKLLTKDSDEPVAPSLLMMDVNVTGVLYRLKLAQYYFLKNPIDGHRDLYFVVFSSAAGYQDLSGGPMHPASKNAMRGFMRSTRGATASNGIRANVSW